MAEALLLLALLAPVSAVPIALLLPARINPGFLTPLAAGVSLVSLLLLSGASLHLTVPWLETAGLAVTLGLRLDGLSWFMALLIVGIALPVSIYAAGDMAHELSRGRFFATLSFFVSAMLALVLADSFVLLFAAWEAVGVASFLLIGFWYRQQEARAAALKAFVVTRFGDLGLLLGWLLALVIVGSTDIDALLRAAEAGGIAPVTLTLLALLFFGAVVGKSAQLPLTTWLPDAMAGPTPISALIHSATMVAAGVYLLLRLFPLFAAAPHALTVVLAFGLLTALIAALIAAGQTDLKRILAWSTASQLGEMMFAVGLGGPLAAAFHLGTHAAFKSSLFLAAGAVDHGTGSRDLNRLGGLVRKMPVTAWVFGAAALALAGIPPFSGFWSEEAILSRAVTAQPIYGAALMLLVFLAGVYMGRATWAVFFRWPQNAPPAARAPGYAMIWGMVLLATVVLALGWVLAGRLESLLQFSSSGELGWSWRFGVIGAGAAGLGAGAWRVWRYGPIPAWGELSNRLEKVLYGVTNVTAHFVLMCARGLVTFEQWLDRSAQALGGTRFAWSFRVEQALDGGLRALGQTSFRLSALAKNVEPALDAGASALANNTVKFAKTIDVAERERVSTGLDRAAGMLGLAGDRLRQLQSGKLYLYTLGLFVWVLVAGIAGFLVWQ